MCTFDCVADSARSSSHLLDTLYNEVKDYKDEVFAEDEKFKGYVSLAVVNE